MSSVYTYSAPYPRNSADVRKSLAHTRNFSSFSNATLFTSSSHSQPTDPLLQHTLESTTSDNSYDRITQHPRNDPVASRLRWNEPLAYSGLQAPISEKPGYHCKPSRLKRSLKRAKFSLELIVGMWPSLFFFQPVAKSNDVGIDTNGLCSCPVISLSCIPDVPSI
jgi:hypothetical protein